MAVLTQPFFAFVRGNFMPFTLFSTRHVRFFFFAATAILLTLQSFSKKAFKDNKSG
jgi:hypothetical protein